MKKSKLFLSMLSLCFALAVLCFGVYAAGQVNYQINGSISYVVDDCYVDVRTSVYSSSVFPLESMYTKISNILEDDYTGLTSVSISDLSYNSLNDDEQSASKSLNLQFTGGENSQMAYFVVMKVKNLGDNEIWADAGQLPTLPDNVYSINSGIQTSIQKNQERTMVIALSVMDVTKEVAEPEDEDETNYTLTLHIEAGECQLLDYIDFDVGDVWCADDELGEDLTELKIPSYINGTMTTNVYGFEGCTSLEYVYIPSSVVSIDPQTFSSDAPIESMILPFCGTQNFDGLVTEEDLNTSYDELYLRTIFSLFNDDNGNEIEFDYDGPLVNGYIPETLHQITLLYGAKTSGVYGQYIDEISLPFGIDSIECCAFYGSGLTEIEIPESVVGIGWEAFGHTNNLLSLHIPKNVSYIGRTYYGDSILYCSQIQSLTIDENNNHFVIENNCLISLPDRELYFGLPNVASSIPANISKIGSGAFKYCDLLINAVIPSGIDEIGIYVFISCKNLTSVTIPYSVTQIGSSAFSGCSSLAKVYYGGSGIADWMNIQGVNNVPNTATRYYYSETQPASAGNYWHYVNGVVTEWA